MTIESGSQQNGTIVTAQNNAVLNEKECLTIYRDGHFKMKDLSRNRNCRMLPGLAMSRVTHVQNDTENVGPYGTDRVVEHSVLTSLNSKRTNKMPECACSETKGIVPKTYANGEVVNKSDDTLCSACIDTRCLNGNAERHNSGSQCDRKTSDVRRRTGKKLQKSQPVQRRRDSFEVIEEWVNISLTNASADNWSFECGSLPSHIEDALNSSIHSALASSASTDCDVNCLLKQDRSKDNPRSSGHSNGPLASNARLDSVANGVKPGQCGSNSITNCNKNSNSAIAHEIVNCPHPVSFQNRVPNADGIDVGSRVEPCKKRNKTLLQKLRDSTDSQSDPIDIPSDCDETENPLRRMDSFELLEEWCNLSLPPGSLENFENILNEGFDPVEKRETIADIFNDLKISNEKIHPDDSVDFLSPNSKQYLVSTPIHSSSKEQLSSKNSTAADVDQVSTSEILPDESFNGPSEICLPCDECPVSPPIESSESATSGITSEVSNIIDDLVTMATDKSRVQCLKLDLDDFGAERSPSPQFVFQEMNFIPSPVSSSETPCFPGEPCQEFEAESDIAGSQEEWRNQSGPSRSDENSSSGSRYSETSNEASASKRVFKERHFCPSPLQLATPVTSRSPSPRPRSPLSSPTGRSDQTSPLQGTLNGLLSPEVSPRLRDEGSSRSSSPQVLRSPRARASPDNLSLDSGALSIASSELENSVENSFEISQNESVSNSRCSNRHDFVSNVGEVLPSCRTKEKPSKISSVSNFSRVCGGMHNDFDRTTPKRNRVTYDLNGRRVVTPSPVTSKKGAFGHLDGDGTPRIHSKTRPRSPGCRKITGPHTVQGTPSPRGFRAGTPSPKIYRAGTPRFAAPKRALSKSASMPNVEAWRETTRDAEAVVAADEVLAKKRQQMAELREERSKLNGRIAKQKQQKSSSPPAEKSTVTSPLLYSGPNAIKLSGIELEAVTRLNTLCNGQQLAKFITKPTADMIAHVQEAREANKVTWSEELTTVISDHGAQAPGPVQTKQPILKSREAGFQFPYNNEPLAPIVLRRAVRIAKTKSLADIDPTKI